MRIRTRKSSSKCSSRKKESDGSTLDWEIQNQREGPRGEEGKGGGRSPVNQTHKQVLTKLSGRTRRPPVLYGNTSAS